MISVPELIVASSMPRLVHGSAHHVWCSCSALTPGRMRAAAVRVRVLTAVLVSAAIDNRKFTSTFGLRQPGEPRTELLEERRVDRVRHRRLAVQHVRAGSLEHLARAPPPLHA